MIWQNLLNCPGPGVMLGDLRHDKNFQSFVESVPALVKDLAHQRLNISLLMEVQYRIASQLRNLATGDTKIKLSQVERGLSQYDQAEIFLEAIGVGVRGHCFISGMNIAEIQAMNSGQIQVGEYLITRPAVFLAPILNKLSPAN